MRIEQYLKIYDFTIPFTDSILDFYNKPEVELSKKGKIIAKGKVTDIRFCEDGELTILDLDKGTRFLAFEMKINGEYHGPFNSHIKAPPIANDDMSEFIDQCNNFLK